MQKSAETISASLEKVPPFPPVAVKLLSLLSQSTVDTNEVADLISSDATFTARLLRRVNSAEFGFVSDITNVRRAVALLGLDRTRQIMFAHVAGAYIGGGLRAEAMRRCWQHTVATAVIAEEIAEACGEFAGVAFTAGIMHDIGRLGLLVAYPGKYERVIRDAAERSLDVLDFEEEEFGAHHAEVGRILAERWGLPTEMGLIAGRHHDPCEGTELDLLRIVHVACALADTLGYDIVKPLIPSSPSDVLAQLPPQARERMARSPRELCERIEERIREYSSEPVDAPPEETLALLASSATAADRPGPSAKADPAPASAVDSQESAAQQNRSNRNVILWIIGGLAAGAAVLLWVLHSRT